MIILQVGPIHETESDVSFASFHSTLLNLLPFKQINVMHMKQYLYISRVCIESVMGEDAALPHQWLISS